MIEQFDTIGIGSLTVVLLTGTFTGMVLAAVGPRSISSAHARSSAASSARRWSRSWARC
jgi:ABC-type transporter Mla maintaining outer membrane lipid asymmetry permease subunit MlaE